VGDAIGDGPVGEGAIVDGAIGDGAIGDGATSLGVSDGRVDGDICELADGVGDDIDGPPRKAEGAGAVTR